MDIDELKEKLSELKQRGYVASLRKGNTGIGYTLETFLGVAENNLQTPDLGEIELKAQRSSTASRITLFTFNRCVWNIKQAEAIAEYGYIDDRGRLALKCGVGSSTNDQGLRLEAHAESFALYHLDDTLIAEWPVQALIERFSEKFPAMVIVHAETRRNSNGLEEFLFNEAYYLREPNPDNFLDLISDDKIAIELRMHLNPNETVRNRGTAFRITDRFLDRCFGSRERLI